MADHDSGNKSYQLLDSGGGRVLERVGDLIFTRGCPPAWWRRKLPSAEWRRAVEAKQAVKEPLTIQIGSLSFVLAPGISLRTLAPELRDFWEQVSSLCSAFAEKQRVPARVLHLFGASAGFTMAAAQGGAAVTYVETSTEALQRARQHASASALAGRDIRWVVDDPVKFVRREQAHSARYDMILLDIPMSGDAKRGGFDLERGLGPLLAATSGMLSEKAIALFVCCRQGHASPTTLLHLLRQEFSVFGGAFDAGEILLRGDDGVPAVPSGVFARWLKAG